MFLYVHLAQGFNEEFDIKVRTQIHFSHVALILFHSVSIRGGQHFFSRVLYWLRWRMEVTLCQTTILVHYPISIFHNIQLSSPPFPLWMLWAGSRWCTVQFLAPGPYLIFFPPSVCIYKIYKKNKILTHWLWCWWSRGWKFNGFVLFHSQPRDSCSILSGTKPVLTFSRQQEKSISTSATFWMFPAAYIAKQTTEERSSFSYSEYASDKFANYIIRNLKPHWGVQVCKLNLSIKVKCSGQISQQGSVKCYQHLLGQNLLNSRVNLKWWK